MTGSTDLDKSVELDNSDPDPAARALLDASEWPLQVLVALTSTGGGPF